MKKLTILLFLFCVLFPVSAFAQMDEFGPFGKNKVIWEKEKENFYQSEHIDFYHALDLNDEAQRQIFADHVKKAEDTYNFLSSFHDRGIEKRFSAFIYVTHSRGFEQSNLREYIIPHDVAGFANPGLLVTKLDFPKRFGYTLGAHEMEHDFQMEIMGVQKIGSAFLGFYRSNCFVEGGAEYLGSIFNSYTSDDTRRIHQRGVAANPEKDLPTWRALEGDLENPYTMCSMIFEFIDDKFGREKLKEFYNRALKEKNSTLIDILKDVTLGEISSPERFDEPHRDYWRNIYGKDMLDRPRPYQNTENFSGSHVLPPEFYYPVVSPTLCDEKIVAFSYQKNGVTLISFKIPPKDKSEYVEDRDKNKKDLNAKSLAEKPEKLIENLTPHLPPGNGFEYLVVQKLENWTLSGSDAYCGKIDGEERVVFFGRKNRDNALFILNPNSKSEDKIEKAIELPLDQAFSPVVSLDGKKVFFSAAHNGTRDIYELEIENRNIRNLTNDKSFDTAPDVSPDGKKLVYVGKDVDFDKLFLLDLETLNKKQITFNRFNDGSPSWSNDGITILYTSDEDNRIWNIYSLDLETQVVRQLSSFFGGVFTPKFAKNEKDRIFTSVYWQYDQYLDNIFVNFELFELRIKKPYREYVMADKKENMAWAFVPNDLFSLVLDEGQIRNPAKPLKKWSLSGGKFNLGLSNYLKGFGYGGFEISDIKENNIYSTVFAFSGIYFRLIDFAYLNREKRLNWGYGFYNHKLPLAYFKWNSIKDFPNQFVFNHTLGDKTSANIFAQYSLSKFARIETSFNLERRNFEAWINKEIIKEFSEYFTDTDKQFFNFFKKSRGFNASFSGSLVRDTVLYSYATEGPIHGNAARVNFEIAPPLGFKNTKEYMTLSFDYRRYKRISDGSLLAFNVRSLQSSRAMGDYVIMGGDATLKTYPFGYLAGNQVIYGSAELRFPFIDAVVFPGGIALGPIRSFLFTDYALAKFSDENFPTQKGASLGIGFQFAGLNYVFAWRELDKFKKRVPDFYISKGWNF